MPSLAFPVSARGCFRAGLVAGLFAATSAFSQTDGVADQRAIDQMRGNPGTPSTSSSSTPVWSESGRSGSSTLTVSGSVNVPVTFYPPMPPLFGGVLPEPPQVNSSVNGRALTAPDELADFVGETFYPALGSRLFQGKVGRKLHVSLANYRSARNTLVDELMIELVRLSTASRAEREAALRAFAPTQAARIEALERDAERLRRELNAGGLLEGSLSSALAESRRWRLGQSSVANPPEKHDAEYVVARTAAYFQDGLLIEQRGLLLEIAMESARYAQFVRGRRKSSDDDPLASFFSPETARMRFPLPQPPALSTRLAHFNAEKNALKAELRDVLVVGDSFTSGKRDARFEGIATSQKARIAALEAEAEEIRRGFDALGDTPPPWVPPIPLELRERIESYNRERTGLFIAHASVQQRAAREASRPSSTATDAPPPQARAEAVRRRMEAIQEASRRFMEEHAEAIDSLRMRYDRIHSDLTDIARGIKAPETKREMNVEDLLNAYRVAMQRFDTIGREEAMYERYKYAMLQPGLSPGQRRLLFRAGHASLAQALPQGEFDFPGAMRPRVAY